MKMLMAQMQATHSAVSGSLFTHTCALMAGLHTPATLDAALRAGSADTANIVENVFCKVAKFITSLNARREAAIGCTRLLCEWPGLSADLQSPAAAQRWVALLVTSVELIEPQKPPGVLQAAGLPAATGFGVPAPASATATATFVEPEIDIAVRGSCRCTAT
jgi:hypothetical protein